jgi:hypothetical protein
MRPRASTLAACCCGDSRHRLNMKTEHQIIQFLNAWIILILPLSIVVIRLGLFKFAGEITEVYRNLFAIPQDLVFIAVSFIMAGLSRTIPAFAMHYSSDREADFAGVLHLIVLLLIAWGLCWSNKIVNILQQNFRVSVDQIERWRKTNENVSWKDTPPEIGSRLLWAVVYVLLISITVAIELLIACGAVGESLRHIQP